jgi:chromate transporter
VAAAALLGLLGARLRPDLFPRPAEILGDEAADSVVDAMMTRGELNHTLPSRHKPFPTLIVGLTLWFAPILLFAVILGAGHVLIQEGLFFSKAAVVTFYAVLEGPHGQLSLIGAAASRHLKWMSAAPSTGSGQAQEDGPLG